MSERNLAQREVRLRFFFPPGTLTADSGGMGALAVPFGVPPRVAAGTGVVEDRKAEPERKVSDGAVSAPASNKREENAAFE